MISIFMKIKSSFILYTSSFIILLTIITRSKANTCVLEHFQSCTGTLETLTDKGLTFGATKADLDAICPDLRKAIKCIHRYTRSCWALERHRHFQKMFKGTGHMVHDLCNNGTYQEEYLKHAPCMKTAGPENEVCVKRYARAVKNLQLEEEEVGITPQAIISKKRRDIADERLKSLCCGFQEYMECTTQTITRTCGFDAGDFSRGFLDKMSSIMTKEYCAAYGPVECGLSSSSRSTTYSILSLLVLSLAALLMS